MGYTPVYAWKASSNSTLNSVTDINKTDKRIAVIDGEMSKKIAQLRFPKANIVSYPQMTSFAQIMTDVKNGKADVFFAEKAVTEDFLENNPDSVESLSVDQPVMAFPVTLMTDQNASLLVNLLNAHIKEMQLDGSLQALANSYGLNGQHLLINKGL